MVRETDPLIKGEKPDDPKPDLTWIRVGNWMLLKCPIALSHLEVIKRLLLWDNAERQIRESSRVKPHPYLLGTGLMLPPKGN